MTPPHELDDHTHQRIVAISEKGNLLAEAGRYEEALQAYLEGFALVPRPVSDWEAGTWLLTAIGDVYFQTGRYREAAQSLKEAMRCPGALGDPFIHLRLGQAQFELHDFERAKDELARAYMGGGDEIFDGEDRKYRNYIRELLRPREDI